MAENEQLAGRAGNGRRPDDAQVIATAFLPDDVNDPAAEAPPVGEETTTAVGWGFFEAGGFEKSKFTQKVEHQGKAGFEERQENFWKRVFNHR